MEILSLFIQVQFTQLQSRDVTYRFFDYHIKDKNGMERQLHIKQAIEVTSYDQNDFHIDNIYKMKNDLLWDNHYFTVKNINVNERQ